MARATLTLVNQRDGTEYDLCATCEVEFASILYGESELSEKGAEKINEVLKEVNSGRKRGGKAKK
jgi:hypothetical protein